ncbi:hypothetical protein ABK040_014980 [Willaertia magna]
MTRKTKVTHSTQKKKKISDKAYMKPLTQTGTGLHLDSWPYNLWEKLNMDYTYSPLDRFRPFQSMLCLSDGHEHPHKEEGGLELIPGFPSISNEYFKATDIKFRDGQTMREKNPWVSPYHVKFTLEEDKPLLGLIRKVKRVPIDWTLSKENLEPQISVNSKDDAVNQKLEYLTEIVKEHDQIPYIPIQKGDFIFFDIRSPHQNSNANKLTHPRCVFYHAYSMAHDINRNTIEALKEKRRNFEHPEDFSSSFRMEQQLMDTKNSKELIPLTTLGECLYNEKDYEKTIFIQQEEQISSEEKDENNDQVLSNSSSTNLFEKMYKEHSHILSKRHLDFFHRYGYVVVENIISEQVCNQLLKELGEYSEKANCPLPVNTIINKSGKYEKMNISKGEFRNISNPFGAMIEFYYLPTQQQLRMDEALYVCTVKLLSNTWCSNLNISKELQQLDSISDQSIPHWKYQCPIESQLDPRKLWLYVDRMNFRIPDK